VLRKYVAEMDAHDVRNLLIAQLHISAQKQAAILTVIKAKCNIQILTKK